MITAGDIYQGTLIDVRTPSEFSEGHHPHAINIPLDQIPLRLAHIKSLKSPLYMCCKSGGRSGSAVEWLSHQGIPSTNVGGWSTVPQ
ncbi:rhodanese-like domain-containing protein [bacterium]|nr:rhodanese-like domain-containing protein [bacterium]